MDLLTLRTAEFSPNPDRTYRYKLKIVWDESKPILVFVMLNPSTADELANDPTVERCERRARQMGYGGIVVLNLFAYRATDPKDLLQALKDGIDIVGPENDTAIAEVIAKCGQVICGWGTGGKTAGRADAVLKMLRAAGVTPYALKINGDGSPKHPLYVAYSAQPVPMPAPL